MTELDRKYGLSIRALDVPERLRGAPVSVEIVSAHGPARRTMLTLSDAPSLESVDGPGAYLVRATLPSGHFVAESAIVPDAANRIGQAELDFGSLETTAPTETADPQPAELPHIRSPDSGVLGSVDEAKRGRVVVSTPQALAHDPMSAVGPGFEWGTFTGWSPDAAGFVMQYRGFGAIDAAGRFTAPLANLPGQPLLLRMAAAGRRDPILIIWSCDSMSRMGRIAADPDGAVGRSGAGYVVSRDHGEPLSASLSAYARAGLIDAVRAGVPKLASMLQDPQSTAELGADAAALSGYVLHKSRDTEAMQRVQELTRLYPDLPDLHVVQGAILIGQGKADNAAEHFSAALDRGAPSYTEGVRVMRDGLNYLADLYPADRAIRGQARRANALAAAANFNSEVTCLRLGKGLAADFD